MSTTIRIARTVGLAAAALVLMTSVAQAKPYEAPTAGAGAVTAPPTRMSPDAQVQWAAPPVRQYGTYMPTVSAPRAGAIVATSTRSTGGVNWAAVSVAATLVMALLALGVALAGRARVRQI